MKWKAKVPDLQLCSLLYLAFPLFVFAWGWLRPFWAFLSTLMLAWGLGLATEKRSSFPIKPIHLVAGIIAVCLLAWLSGMGGFVPQQDDYLKHNQLWQDLVKLPWPIGYHFQGEKFVLSYYLAYYLPPAFFAKITGLSSLAFWSFLWGSAGLCLVFLWGMKFGGKKIWLLPLVLLLFGGQDLIWRLVVEYRFFLTEGHWGSWHWDEMGLPYEAGLGHKLPTHFGALSWAPQHFVPGALAGCLVLNDFDSKKNWLSLPFVQALTLLWSPFVTIGLLPFVMFVCWKERKTWIRRSYQFLPAILLGLLVGLFFLAHQNLDEKGWVWTQSRDRLWPIYLVFFGLMKFVPLALLLFVRKNGPVLSGKILLLSLLWLVLAMFYWMGHANDFYMRASLPAWFILSVFLAKEMIHFNPKSWRKWLLLLWFLGGSIIPMFKILNHSQAARGRGVGFANTLADPEKSFIQIKEVYTQRGLIGKDKLWDQYVGDPSHVFFRFFSKKIKYQDNP